MASLEILCPNGRHTVTRVSGNIIMQKVLEEACKKYEYNPIEYELRHGGRTIDLSCPFRLSGLLNHSKLEMRATTVKRRSEQLVSVRVAVQFEGGERRSVTLPTSSTLADVLSAVQAPTSPEPAWPHPVIVYMQETIPGERCLAHTTLAQLGITKPSVLRLIHQNVDAAEMAKREKVYSVAGVDSGGFTQKANDPVTVVKSDGQPIASQSRFAETRVYSGEMADEQLSPDTCPVDPGLSAVPAVPAVSAVPAVPAPTEIPTISAMSDDWTHGSSGSPTENPGVIEPASDFSDCPMMSHFGDAGGISIFGADTEENERTATNSRAATLSEILGLPSLEDVGSGRARTIRDQPANFAQFKFPTETAGQDLYRNAQSDLSRDDLAPCDRHDIVFSLAERASTTAYIDRREVTEDFFNITEGDVRRMMVDLRRQVSELTEKPLMTKALKDAKKSAKYSRYSRSVLRIHFPDRTVLQSIFKPTETVYAIVKHLKMCISQPDVDFYLYTAPPKQKVNVKQTLIQADLVPFSVVYFGCDAASVGSSGPFLKSAMIEATQPYREAEKSIIDCFQEAQLVSGGRDASVGSGLTRDTPPCGSSHYAGRSAGRSAGHSEGRSEPANLPKWMQKRH